jgi:hypothetical protein
MTEIDKTIALLTRLRERLQQIENQLLDIEGRVDALYQPAVAVKPLSLSEFTTKIMNGNEKANASNPRTAEEHSAR